MEFSWNERYASDFCRDFYSAQGGVTPLLSQYNQQMLIINTKDMLDNRQLQMAVLTESYRGKQGSEIVRDNSSLSGRGQSAVNSSIPAEYF